MAVGRVLTFVCSFAAKSVGSKVVPLHTPNEGERHVNYIRDAAGDGFH